MPANSQRQKPWGAVDLLFTREDVSDDLATVFDNLYTLQVFSMPCPKSFFEHCFSAKNNQELAHMSESTLRMLISALLLDAFGRLASHSQ